MSRNSSQRQQRSRGDNPSQTTADPQLQYITEATVLAELCGRLREAGSFGFDTEFVMEDRYQSEICVVQLATASEIAIVDPFEVEDLSPVWSLMADANVEVVVHSGMEDLALCHSRGGLVPQRVFDCQVACGLISEDYPLNLSRMTKSLLGIRLYKSQTLTDWRRRPLSPEQLHYAADDVAHLPAMRGKLHKRLVQLGRSNWMDEEMTRFHAPETYVRGTDEAVFRLKGAGSLDGKGLCFARELVEARCKLAAQYDRPARAVVRDHLIIEIARHRWTTASQIKSLRGLNLRAQGLRTLAEAAQRASQLPREQWPTPVPQDDETNEEAALALLIGAVVRAYCAEHRIAHQLVGTKRDLRAYVRAHVRGQTPDPSPALRAGWRAETVGVVIKDVLSGRAAVVLREDGQRLTVVPH